MNDDMKGGRSPWWFGLLLISVSVPALWFEATASRVLKTSGWIASDITTWLYPAYVIISAFSAWFCYPDRKRLAWILFVLLLITNMAFLLLANII